MSSTNGVLILLQVLPERFGVLLLDEMHAFPVEIFDGLVDRAVGGVIVCEPEALPPVAKVRGDDEERRGAI